MKKRLGVLGAAIGLLALVVGAVSPALGSSSSGSASASSDDANEGQSIRVIAVFKETAEIDNGAQGFSLGDEVVFSGTLRQSGERVGHTAVVCTFTSAAHPKNVAAQCPATADLPGGQITLQGLVFNRDLRVLPITGGSGQYQGADGEMQVLFRSQSRAVLTFHLED
jgi:allene oxide cyclase-like protein